MPPTLVFLLLVVALPPLVDPAAPIGNEPAPMVLILGEADAVQRFQPLDSATFGKDGRRRFDYDFVKADGSAGEGLTRRKVEADEPVEPIIPLGLGTALVDGRPCVVLEMDKPQGKAAITKGVEFSLRLRAVEPKKLRETFGPGVYEGLAWLRFVQPDPTDPMSGERKHLLRLRVVIPGRRVARLNVSGPLSVGHRVKVEATVEEILAKGSDESVPTDGDRLKVELVPEGESATTLDLPWPMPVGTQDPRELGAKGERAGWIIPSAWLDEPISVGDSGSKTETPVDSGPARSVVHRHSLRLPPLFAPGRLSARLTLADAAPKVTAEISIRSGLMVSPSLAFLGEPIILQAKLAVGKPEGVNPPESIKLQATDPNGRTAIYELTGERRPTGYVTYDKLKNDKARPRALLPGTYKFRPTTGDAALDEELGGDVAVLVALEKDDKALARERVVFLGTTPIHWPLIVWLSSGLKDGSMHRAETRGAIFLKSIRGPEEISDLSLTLSQIGVPARQRPHDDEKDGKLQFSGPEKASKSPWPFDRKGLSLDLSADVGNATAKGPAVLKGRRDRFARFLVAGIGPDHEPIGRIFVEPASYKIAAHWDYYQEWAWLPALIVAALGLWWYVRHVTRRKPKGGKKGGKAASTTAADPSTTGQGRFSKAWTEPKPKPAGPAPAESAEPPRRPLPDKPGPSPGGGKRRFD